MEYTRGEWQVVDHAWRDKELPFDKVIFVETSRNVVARTWNRADAQLIASAPDLYEALKGMVEIGLTGEVQQQIMKALAKAEGK